MALDALLARLEGWGVTPVTLDGVTPKPAPVQACTSVTAVTSQIINAVVNVGADFPEILEWLAHIGETDQEIIDDVLRRCQQDADVRSYFTGRAAAETLQAPQGGIKSWGVI